MTSKDPTREATQVVGDEGSLPSREFRRGLHYAPKNNKTPHFFVANPPKNWRNISSKSPHFLREIYIFVGGKQRLFQSMAKRDPWTREQLIMALNAYCKIPFKDVKEWHPVIQKYAPLIGRTPVALKMKVGNFGRFDPVLKAKGITGLANGSKAEEPIWNEFWGNSEKLAYESERLFAERAGKTVEDYAAIDIQNIPQGKVREAIVRQRVNQNFFRTAVLTAYLNQCCITGITNTILLEACHISGWADDENNRTNPRNGLCMNPLFHRAYDKYLFAVTPDGAIEVSEQMIDGVKDETFRAYLQSKQGSRIIMPEKFSPDKDLLAQHYEQYRAKQ